MYDWANSAYVMLGVGLLPIFFTRTIVGEQGWSFGGHVFAGDTLWAAMLGTADLLAFLVAPVLGAAADFTAAKRRMLLLFAYTGACFTLLMALPPGGAVPLMLVLFTCSQVAFINAGVFYDAFLPQIASDANMDRVSGKGFAFGYLGGGLQFALALGLIVGHERLGVTQEMAARLAIGLTALWWAGFALYTARFLPELGTAQAIPPHLAARPRLVALAAIGLQRTWKTLRQVRKFKHLMIFLLAFIFYNDGIQTVINMATAFGSVELKLPAWALMVTLLIIQFVAMAGALLFSRIAGWIGTRNAIMVTVALWAGVVLYAYQMTTMREYFALGVIVGLVMGGSQALSRSLYAVMIPENASAEFFGFYTVFTRFSAIWGPWLFAAVRHTAGSSRQAILSLVVFFVVGLILLAFVDEKRAKQARLEVAF